MNVLRSHRGVPTERRGAVLAIGNFDGVHRGHQAVLDRARQTASESGAPAGALVFEPHPRQFFQPDVPLFRLTPEPLKLELESFVECVQESTTPLVTGEHGKRALEIAFDIQHEIGKRS